MTLRLRNPTAFGTIILAGISAPAFAAGTTAGSTITNTVSIGYSVGGVAQTAINASNTFTVDRKITLSVTETGTTTTVVAPGQIAAVTTFTVSNGSNATLDLGLSVAQQVGGTAQHGGTDNFDVTAPTLYVDTNTNGVYDPGTDTVVSYLDEVAADTSRTVFVVANIPVARVNGDIAGVTLTAQARDGGAAGTQGAVSVETTGANTAGQDTVFADLAGATDAARDGQFSARDDYTVSGALLTITKTSKIISDPSNNTTNPKMIPGAIVEYCIQAANAAGGAAATNVAISDMLPTQTTYLTAFGIQINGTVTSGSCDANGTAGGTFSSGTISGTLASIPAGSARTLYFRATIN
ncbi:DUF11 domain-containing protein [Sphingomonas paeninsulae]|uniref:DUF11 domain-containing protein n=1 Tax=Sphingomonas paeninsulae TaxID=2319844 RepID=A0A494TJY7_SPHPE|nr:DUF11 domain-containing protein [Sphingomonas paeninsulae]AYJ85738.1 DUF11 domain-containing protein [Sphingomonas paeninsulae]